MDFLVSKCFPNTTFKVYEHLEKGELFLWRFYTPFSLLPRAYCFNKYSFQCGKKTFGMRVVIAVMNQIFQINKTTRRLCVPSLFKAKIY